MSNEKPAPPAFDSRAARENHGDDDASLTQVAGTSFIWAFASLISNRAAGFITILVLARILAPSEFGTFAAALVVLGFLNVVLELGISSTIVHEQDTGFGPTVESAFTLSLMMSVVGAVGLILAAPTLSDALGASTGSGPAVMRVVAVTVVLRGIGKTHDALLRRDLRFRTRTKVKAAQGLMRLAASVGAAAVGAGVWALVVGIVVSEATATIGLWVAVPFRPKLRLDRSRVIAILKFGGAVTVMRFVAAVMADADYVVVGSRLGSTALGLYLVAFRLPELIVGNVLTTFSQVAFPVLSRAREMALERLRAAVLRSLSLVTIFGFTAGTGLALVAHDATAVLFGDTWASSATPMVLLTLAIGIGSVGYGVGDLFLALGRPMLRVWMTAVVAVPAVTALWIVAPHGIIAVAWVHLGGAVASSLIQLGVAKRLIGISAAEIGRSLRSSLSAVTGLIIVALPPRLVLSDGLGRLIAVMIAGVVGALLGGLAADRTLPAQLRELTRGARGWSQ